MTNNSHVTLSSQCIRSHSVEKYIPVLCSICLSKRVFSKVCALSLYTGFPYIQSGFMQSYGHVWHLNSTVFSFLPLLPLPKKWLGNKDVSQNVRCASRWGQKKRGAVFVSISSPPAVVIPLKPGDWDMTTQSERQKHTRNKLQRCTFWINSSAVHTQKVTKL